MELDWLDDEARLEAALLMELDEYARALYRETMSLACGTAVLSFMHSNAHTLLTTDDIAFNVQFPYGDVERDLETLVDWGLVRRVEVAGVTFFTLTDDDARLQMVRELVSWQERWESRIARIQEVVHRKMLPLYRQRREWLGP